MEFSHFDAEGQAVMVDVAAKAPSLRQATAQGYIQMSGECFQKVAAGNLAKGDVLGVARVAGIMAAKKTAELIPLCHPLSLSRVAIEFELLAESRQVKATCVASAEGKTGVEMEALTGVEIALLTIYDMCKAVDQRMVLNQIHLVEKTGGKSGDFKW